VGRVIRRLPDNPGRFRRKIPGAARRIEEQEDFEERFRGLPERWKSRKISKKDSERNRKTRREPK